VKAHAKINLALVVGPTRPDGKHELLTLFQRVSLADEVTLELATATRVEGFADDTIVAGALAALAATAGAATGWSVRIEKRIPVAAGLAGGSTDAAAALRLANETLAEPLLPGRLHELAVGVGADVPFFLTEGPQLGAGAGGDLIQVELPQDFHVVLVLPEGEAKPSTGAIYAAFDARDGAAGFPERAENLREALAAVRTVDDLAALPPNDLASSPLAGRLRELGAFRADVSGAGPTVYGLWRERDAAVAAAAELEAAGRVWVVQPAW
jgi:4-diphosphocytidyl-2-C-methyl-D-erythritol kinase